jgi:hypothetical protein
MMQRYARPSPREPAAPRSQHSTGPVCRAARARLPGPGQRACRRHGAAGSPGPALGPPRAPRSQSGPRGRGERRATIRAAIGMQTARTAMREQLAAASISEKRVRVETGVVGPGPGPGPVGSLRRVAAGLGWVSFPGLGAGGGEGGRPRCLPEQSWRMALALMRPGLCRRRLSESGGKPEGGSFDMALDVVFEIRYVTILQKSEETFQVFKRQPQICSHAREPCKGVAKKHCSNLKLECGVPKWRGFRNCSSSQLLKEPVAPKELPVFVMTRSLVGWVARNVNCSLKATPESLSFFQDMFPHNFSVLVSKATKNICINNQRSDDQSCVCISFKTLYAQLIRGTPL